VASLVLRAFTLPPSLETIGGGFSIIPYGTYPTTSIIAPNLKTIGYGNETDVDPDVIIYRGTYNCSFPALTAVAGNFYYDNYTVQPVFDGFPVLATVGGSVLNF